MSSGPEAHAAVPISAGPTRRAIRVRTLLCRAAPGARVGVDVVPGGRLRAALARRGPAFAASLFRPEEQASFAGAQDGWGPERSFAIKEAFLKALGTGLMGGISLLDVATDGGDLVLHGALGALGRRLLVRTRGVRAWDSRGHQLALVWLDRSAAP